MANFSDAMKVMFLEHFNDIGTQDAQDVYLAALITTTPTRRRRAGAGPIGRQ